MSRTPNPQQQAAIDARGSVFVSAGAGTGKTTVLVERFARSVAVDGLDVDSLLVITYTDRAAGELRARIRARMIELGRPQLARELDGAWISTIHGFCRRLLSAYPLAAGIDPRFRVLDEAQARVLQGEAFGAALDAFCAADEHDRWQLLATYRADGLRAMLVGVYDTLRSAGRELVLEPGAQESLPDRLAELEDAARRLAADESATDLQRAAARGALDLLATTTLPERLLELDDYAARGARAATYNDARTAVRAAALEMLASRDRELLQELLAGFADAYAAAKDRESALDFEDLQLRARDLLREHATIREAEQLRFRSIMVDEFQDTNRLQTDIIDLLSRSPAATPPAGAALTAEPRERESGDLPLEKEIFFVGDEFQSIYGFRHADVAVFRERREAAPQVLPLTLNYRSRPELLAAVNELFAAEFGGGFQPLEAAGGHGEPAFGTPVELLVTDKRAFSGTGVHWRRAEALQVARRVRELVDAGVATPGEIVLLFAAGTDAEWFEEELRAVDLPTYRMTGRRYFGQQQVVDLLSYLRLLHNRYDDEALLTVLASPFVGVSNDALVLIRADAERRPIFKGIERGLPPDLADDDRRLVRAFLQRYDRLVEASARLSLELLCERILVEHDYDLAVLARRDGRRRYANLRKLARLARSYEELRGPDIEGFVRFVAEQEAAGARELDAVSEEEGADAVRLLTIHAAKGLEFKVVVVADAGRERARVDEILCLSDGRFGFKVAHPATGSRVGTTSYQDVKETREREDEAERLRLYYVAMTRAMERLVVSGSVDLESERPERTPIAWVLERLALRDELRGGGDGPVEVERGRARVVVRPNRYVSEPPAVAAGEGTSEDAEEGQLLLFEGAGEELPSPAPRLREPVEIPAAPIQRVNRLSYSAISLFDRCSYRFYAERIAGMQPAAWERAGKGGGGLHATELGDAVHRLLERVDLAAPRAPAPGELEETVRAWYPAVTGEEASRIAALVDAYCGSALAQRIASLAGARPERPFAFELDGVLVNGRLDVLWQADEQALVLDYKTNPLLGREPADIVDEEYRTQRNVYALACLRAGAREAEIVYQFLEAPERVVTSTFTGSDLPQLEAELSASIARIRAGDFRPTPSPLACSGCPALDVVCAGPRLGDGPAAPAPALARAE
ncbi:UvrD/REP helicase N-terminal domain [Gaiella occulta]|uniref:DNA 3'-5' helicase n=1 Tax=Gaiella occulta TaxID=1002870 RepID=A0A7M2YUE2_9ACTN|nr:UvrD-helicase domain-containing protein [Gaiella occulta]RDI73771.1 UvrD/REP helicase N-terminal domain [Gaiella occulta]